MDADKLLEKIIKRNYTGWSCPNCNRPTWTGIDGCPICGLELWEAQILNGCRSSPYDPTPEEIKKKHES